MNRVYVENEQKINITIFDNNEQFFEHKQVVIEFYKRLHLNWIGPVIFNVMTSSFVSTIFENISLRLICEMFTPNEKKRFKGHKKVRGPNVAHCP